MRVRFRMTEAMMDVKSRLKEGCEDNLSSSSISSDETDDINRPRLKLNHAIENT